MVQGYGPVSQALQRRNFLVVLYLAWIHNYAKHLGLSSTVLTEVTSPGNECHTSTTLLLNEYFLTSDLALGLVLSPAAPC